MTENKFQLPAPTERQRSRETLETACLDTALAAMRVVQPAQLGLVAIGESAIKPADETFVTPLDVRAEKAAKAAFKQALPDIPVVGEETGGDSSMTSGFVAEIDPVDGTIDLLASAGTSTTIVGIRDTEKKQTLMTTIGQPISGRVWRTENGKTVRQVFDIETGQPKTESVECRVWEGELSSKSIVFVETDRGFTRVGRQILDDTQAARLSAILQPSVRKLNYGSNGMHQALVANGGDYVAGSITTAMGGTWDALGARLVIDAGGSAVGLKVTADRQFLQVDPLDPHSYDMLITANNPETLAFLADAVRESMNLNNN